MALKNSFKNMVISLTGICFVCAGLLGGFYVLTAERIAEAERAARQAAINQVLPEYSGELKTVTVEHNGCEVEIFVAYNDTTVAGYAIPASKYGFSSDVALMVGFLPDGTINSIAVLSQAETPGLGAKCVEPGFAEQFVGHVSQSALSVVKDGGDIDAITAATITSRAYVDAVNIAIEIYKEVCHE